MLCNQQTAPLSSSQLERRDAATRLAPFVPQAQPGYRLPHCLLAPVTSKADQGGDAPISSIDLCASGWTAIASGQQWAETWLASGGQAWCKLSGFRQIWIVPGKSAPSSADAADSEVFRDTSGSWDRIMQAGSGLVLLVRPDGHIAARIDDTHQAAAANTGAADQIRILQNLLHFLLPQPQPVQ